MKLNRVLAIILSSSVVTSISHAATEQLVWGKLENQLQTMQLIAPSADPIGKSLNAMTANKSSAYQMKLQGEFQADQTTHGRYQLLYKGIPIFGYRINVHQAQNGKAKLTGVRVSGIERDVSSIQAKLSPQMLLDKATESYRSRGLSTRFQRVVKVIYIDKGVAKLAYHVSFYSLKNKKMMMPNFIFDANTGDEIRQWNGAHQAKKGQGLGGNAIDLPYRKGTFQFGNAFPSTPDIPSLGKFDVQVRNGECLVQNKHFKLINLANIVAGYEAFPITIDDENANNFNTFSYPCAKSSKFINYTDGQTAPINYAFSPINDTMYFAQQTVDMYQKLYGVNKPFGNDLPLRAYTHLGLMDNAFAIPSIYMDGKLVSHQQIIIGNGDQFLTPPTQSVIAHELSHNFTSNNSDLIYVGQPGGINEAFSDMAAIAMQDYVRQSYPWYWDGKDWTLGREAMQTGKPLRYLDDPTQDGMSIGHASDYTSDLDVHFSSGVFNKAFYLLSTSEGWSVAKAFQIMVDANQKYWSPLAYYDFASCGVIMAALDRHFDTDTVINAFDQVGVHCPLSLSALKS